MILSRKCFALLCSPLKIKCRRFYPGYFQSCAKRRNHGGEILKELMLFDLNIIAVQVLRMPQVESAIKHDGMRPTAAGGFVR